MTMPQPYECSLIAWFAIGLGLALLKCARDVARESAGPHPPSPEEIKLTNKIERARKIRKSERKELSRFKGLLIRYKTGSGP